ncbi:MAG: fumarylacetoacetate hydrolase family protein [Betaproteobacteria bacterium]
MKLATLRTGGRDGKLIVVSRDLKRGIAASEIAPSLQNALDDWQRKSAKLRALYEVLNRGKAADAFRFDAMRCAAPLPRAYQWVDGSAYVNHVELVRRARGVEMPPSFWTDPLMYQGGSDSLCAACDPILAESEDWGIDLEGEVAVVIDDVRMATPANASSEHIKLIMLANDVSFRNLIPGELAKGFGFMHSKPATAFSPVAVTPDELGDAWDGHKINLALTAHINGQPFGRPNAGDDMTFDFPQLIAHAARTRQLKAGTIVGSGTISNVDRSRGSVCLAETRMLETIAHGKAVTPFLRFGDRVRLEMFAADGQSIFGAIDQEVVRYTPPD